VCSEEHPWRTILPGFPVLRHASITGAPAAPGAGLFYAWVLCRRKAIGTLPAAKGKGRLRNREPASDLCTRIVYDFFFFMLTLVSMPGAIS
jgi:hypothetical protein